MTGASVRFDEHQIQLIIKALPDGVSSRKRELLPKILNEWSGHYLKYSLYRVDPTVAKGRAKRAEAIARHAGELSRALDEFVDYAGGRAIFEFSPVTVGLCLSLRRESLPWVFKTRSVAKGKCWRISANF